jgi:hypothetical protein
MILKLWMIIYGLISFRKVRLKDDDYDDDDDDDYDIIIIVVIIICF